MKLIIISQRIDDIIQRNEIRDSLDQQLTNFLIKGGYLPVAIPNILLNQSEIEKNKYFEKWLSTLNPDGILLSGGNDIGEFESRDITERYLLDYAFKTKKPLLGICRGMQLMATWAGCGLKKVENHAATYHKIEFKDKTDTLMKNLEVDETLGQLLVAEGFSTIEEIKDSEIDNLSKIEGIEEETAKELVQRAKEFFQKDQEEIQQKIKDLGIQADLIDHKGLTPGMLLTLGEQKILSLNDFADLASDELIGGFDIIKGERIKIKGYLEDFALSRKEADDLIMSARDKIYKN